MTDSTFLESVSRDLLYALRGLRKNPAFAAVAVLTLAFGIGANTVSFSVIRAKLLKALEYHSSHESVDISGGATPRAVRGDEGRVAELYRDRGVHERREFDDHRGRPAVEDDALIVIACFMPIATRRTGKNGPVRR